MCDFAAPGLPLREGCFTPGPRHMGRDEPRAARPMPLHWINSALRDAAAYVLPRGVYAHLQEARRQRPLRKRSSDELDLSRIELLRTADRNTLRDPGWLERQGLPDLGLNHEFLYEGRWPLLPAWLHERAGGLLAWQLPCQFGPYLAHLTRYPISSYLEIGVRHGGTFVITVEYLRRFREIEKGLAVDLSETPALAEYR